MNEKRRFERTRIKTLQGKAILETGGMYGRASMLSVIGECAGMVGMGDVAEVLGAVAGGSFLW